MVVRGAPAIGCTAAYGLYLGARAALLEPTRAGRGAAAFEKAKSQLHESRPTAVNLSWALERMARLYNQLVMEQASPAALLGRLLEEAHAITAEDLAACKAEIGAFGAPLVPDGKGILTHCNAGGLATAGYGTALGVIRAARLGKRLPGVRRRDAALAAGRAAHRLGALARRDSGGRLPDVAAASLLASGRIGCVVVGAEIAANGDVANKVGAYGLALAAQAHGVPLYVAAPVSTLERARVTGATFPSRSARRAR